MTLLNDNSKVAGSRLVNFRRWLLEAAAKFRFGGGLAATADGRRPFLDDEIIAAVCECPALTYELLVATREDVAVERVELDETSRPAVGLVRDDGGGSPRRRPR